MNGRYHRLPSQHMGRDVHLWAYGHFGPPMIVFPTAAGFAHEWQQQGMIDALAPLLQAGRLKLYCPESNVAEAWTRRDRDPRWRISRHLAYERFVLEELVPAVRADCNQPGGRVAVAGASLGAMYAANMALKFPETFWWALCMSGRYEVRGFTDGHDDADVYYNNPLAYVWNLDGAHLQRVREHTGLTLVCGQGQYEDNCIEETTLLAHALATKGVPVERDLWGHDVAHDWTWWQRQARLHLTRRFGA